MDTNPQLPEDNIPAFGVAPSALPSAAMATIRYLATALGTMLLARGYLENQDELQTFVGLILTVAPVMYAVYREWILHCRLRRLAERVPDSIAFIKPPGKKGAKK